ncbi:MAG: glycosyltransferase family 39 protein [bacterium]|nr:glycosyltransferase family 39 protein [bacterium]
MLPILSQSYWRDEVFSVLLSSNNLKDVFILATKDTSPPLYYLLLHFWIKLFGDAEYVTRSLSLLFLFLLATTCFFLVKKLVGDWKISLLGSLSVLLNPFLIEYGFETRAYTLFAFLIAVAVYFYLAKKRLLFSISLALAIFTHYFGIFFLIAFLTFWFFENKGNLKLKFLEFTVLFGIPIITFLVWLEVLWNQWVKVASGFWVQAQTSSIFVEAFRAFFQGSKDYPSKGMLYNLTIILVFLGFSYWIMEFVKNKTERTFKESNLLLFFIFSIPFLVTYIISTFWVPIYHERFLIPILPIFITFIVYSLVMLAKLNKTLSYLIVAFSFAYVLFGVQSTEEIMKMTTKPAINYAIKQIISQSKEGDVIIPEQYTNFLETKYYAQKYGSRIPVYAYSPGGDILFYAGAALFQSKDIITEYPKDKRIWVVTPSGGYDLKGN